jgi:16S rRNA U1498 N3-methylase RsmE
MTTNDKLKLLAGKDPNATSSISSSRKSIEKTVKICQNNDKIMQLQNKWTGNGRFILRERSSMGVSVLIFILKYKLIVF